MTGVTNGVCSNGTTQKSVLDYSNKGFETRAIQVGQNPDQWASGIVVPPIHTGTTFKQDGPGLHRVKSS